MSGPETATQEVFRMQSERIVVLEQQITALRESLQSAETGMTHATMEWNRQGVRAEKAEAFLERAGYRRCDIAACNCGSWHSVSAKAKP